MGPGGLAAVADTGPLIHLAEINCLPLLAVFAQLHIPASVWREAERPATIRSEVAFATHHVLPPAEVVKFTADNGLDKLQLAERECLLPCSKLDVSLLLTDDLAVRKAAQALGMTPIGSLGIIARAHRLGLISMDAAARHMRGLYTVSSLFVTPTIVDLAIERLRAEGSGGQSS
jgi:predicted nucleic acid-binding protein